MTTTNTSAAHFYRISNRVSGAILGVYGAETEAEAFDALARDAGYANAAAMGHSTDLDAEEMTTLYQVVTGAESPEEHYWTRDGAQKALDSLDDSEIVVREHVIRRAPAAWRERVIGWLLRTGQAS